MNIINNLFNNNTNLQGKGAGISENLSNYNSAPLNHTGKISQMSGIKPGFVFEGVVKEVNGNRITLSLANGETISARLEAKGTFTEGASVSFVVKSNNGEQIMIRPMQQTDFNNPTLLKALNAAGLEVNSTNLEMVKTMMKEQMNVNKQSLNSMFKLMSGNPSGDVKALVLMTKFNIPINESNITQFNNYVNLENQIIGELDYLGDSLMEGLSELALSEEVMGFVADNEGELAFVRNGVSQEAAAVANESEEAAVNVLNEAEAAAQNEVPAVKADDGFKAWDIFGTKAAEAEAVINEQPVMAEVTEGKVVGEPKTQIIGETIEEAAEMMEEAVADNTPSGSKLFALNGKLLEIATEFVRPEGNISSMLSEEELAGLSEALGKVGVSEEMLEQVKSGDISGDRLLLLIKDALSAENEAGALGYKISESIRELIGNGAYNKILKNGLMNQWTLTPDEILETKPDELMNKIDRHMKEILQNAGNLGKLSETVSDSAGTVRGNVDFMTQINQMYTYIQVPLKMAGENAHSDLYVFANKKKALSVEDGVTALLRLDMEHLGKVNVYLKLQNNKLDTKFAVEDDESLQLIIDNVDTLTAALTAAGYECTTKVTEFEKEVDFVEDFLKQEEAAPVPVVRYSFDVKA